MKLRETEMETAPTATIPLTDLRLAAAAPLQGGKLASVECDPNGRVTLTFNQMPANFLQAAFNGTIVVNLRDYISQLENVQALVASYRARRR